LRLQSFFWLVVVVACVALVVVAGCTCNHCQLPLRLLISVVAVVALAVVAGCPCSRSWLPLQSVVLAIVVVVD